MKYMITLTKMIEAKSKQEATKKFKKIKKTDLVINEVRY